MEGERGESSKEITLICMVMLHVQFYKKVKIASIFQDVRKITASAGLKDSVGFVFS